jgi:hypothetical protein
MNDLMMSSSKAETCSQPWSLFNIIQVLCLTDSNLFLLLQHTRWTISAFNKTGIFIKLVFKTTNLKLSAILAAFSMFYWCKDVAQWCRDNQWANINTWSYPCQKNFQSFLTMVYYPYNYMASEISPVSSILIRKECFWNCILYCQVKRI